MGQRNIKLDSVLISEPQTVTVTRAASTDTGSEQVETGIYNAPSFICSFNQPAASPKFVFPNPRYVNDGTGLITNEQFAYYDPTTGVVKFQVYAITTAANFAVAETWVFTYYFMFQTNQ